MKFSVKFLLLLFLFFLFGNTFLIVEANQKCSKQEIALYMQKMEKNIKKNWTPKRSNIPYKLVILFEIDKTGKLLKAKVKQSSNIDNADDFGIKAIEATAPFDVPPACIEAEIIPIEFVFDYKIINKIPMVKNIID